MEGLSRHQEEKRNTTTTRRNDGEFSSASSLFTTGNTPKPASGLSPDRNKKFKIHLDEYDPMAQVYGKVYGRVIFRNKIGTPAIQEKKYQVAEMYCSTSIIVERIELVPPPTIYLSTEIRVRFILIGERFFQKFQSLEIIGDMYQYTEAFCHYS